MIDELKTWWKFDAEAEQASADNPLTPLTSDQRRDAIPLLTMAFGWGFLITGLIVGGALGSGVTFWPDLIYVSFLGNIANFVIGALVGYIGYKTACNSGLLYRFVYGEIGAYFPVLFLALVLICWQGIVVGAFGFAWAQSFDSPTFYLVALFAGALFTWTTYYGVRGLELVSAPSVVILIIVGVYAAYTQVSQAGGIQEFLALSETTAAINPISNMDAINIVIGSWIVGAIVMPEYTRFAKNAWVALAIPFIVMIIAQWFLQIIGSAGGIVSGQYDFTTYMRLQGVFVAGLGLIGMSMALWTTGDANLYLPVIQTSSLLRRPQKVMTVICGVLGTIVGLVIYQHFIQFIDKLAILLPPLIGPVIAHFYIVKKRKFNVDKLDDLPKWNVAALIAYMIGASSKWWLVQDLIVSSLAGLLVSIVAYLALYYGASMLRVKLGHSRLSD
ncbi:cytosine permease [Porticoccaceae bacterium]|jgi:cytosine permease|nr:cytosine permease [Porticoccaceae bacterium]|tara:strand:+ start:6892 stop:8223 length:1332 start_codon:yes stop_codon:yes gene_type:complete